ncbi:MAG: sigma-E processing peptidase SpoIIGA [Lachnospiraceae bacterium]|nr:sigma-E processing peptidase SpoIIGA [Lachnospiraceae bacterium]
MQYTVYVDVLFLVNWVMDYVLLWAVCAVMGLQRKKVRLGLAAALGAGWVCVIAVFSLPYLIKEGVTWLGISSLMIWIACRPRKLSDFLNRICVLYLVAFLAGGGLNLIYFHTSAGVYLKQVVLGIQKVNSSGVGVILGSIAMILTVTKMLDTMEKQKKRRKNRYVAELYFGERRVLVDGFIDTGNRLKEPITGKIVHILQEDVAASLMSAENKPMSFLVPYHAVGTESGLLTAIRIDRMELVAEDESRTVIMRPLFGLYQGKLSSNDEYQLILHAETKTEQGGNV